MIPPKTSNTRKILAGLNFSGLDRVYQQLDTEIGMILTFHHVKPVKQPIFAPNAHLSVHPAFLEEVIKLLRRREFDIISLDEAHERIKNPAKTFTRFAALTFDDGYKDTLEHAVPVLQKYQVPYTVYVAPGLIERSADLWWEGIEALIRQQDRILLQNKTDSEGPQELDCTTLEKKYRAFDVLLKHLTEEVPEKQQRQRVREICWLYKIDLDEILEKEMMGWKEIHQLMSDPLCTMGAHTLNHEALARLDEAAAKAEVINGASVLEAELGERPRHFAFPYGYRAAAGAREFELLKKLRFKTAVTTRGGMIFPEHKDHLTALPRISVNGLFQRLRYFAPLTTGLPTRLSTKFKRLDVR